MLEEKIVEHCSPTLASLKTGNLFTFNFSDKKYLEDMKGLNRKELAMKDLYMVVLKRTETSALVYFFRYSRLEKDLNRRGVPELLKKCGYESTDIPYALSKLRERVKEAPEFPHEIGLFLGYPIGDVYGFIKNKGKNSKCTGCWKVYCDQCEAEKKFRQFEKCSEIYKKLFQNGRPLNKLAVARKI